jgi:hypothetical protein
MANTIKIKRSAVPGKVPTTGDLSLGELGLNTYDGKLFTKKSVSGVETIVELSGGGGGGGQAYTFSATAPSSPSAGAEWLDSSTGILYTYVNDGNTSAWVELGAPGFGPVGPQGPAATVAVGSTTTGAAGSSASVTNAGTTGAAVLNFTVPRGDTGLAATVAVGSTTTGAPGTSASVTNSGTSGAATFNFTIPRGDTGATGTAATIAVGTVTTGAAGSSATVTNSGTSSAATFNFTIPRGNTGLTGATGPMGPKSVSIANPTTTEKVALFFTTSAQTVSQIRSAVFGSNTPSVTFSIRYGTDLSTAGTEVDVGGITVTNTTTGLSTTTFDNASIPANNWVWLTTSAKSGTVDALNVSITF